jgi:hypothetical protein
LEPESTQEVGTSSQPHSYATIPSFTFEPDYQTSFDPYLASPQIDSIQVYFGYIAQSIYHMNLNQQVFQTRVNNEISTLKSNLTRMKDCQHNFQTNWVNKYENWVDNTVT